MTIYTLFIDTHTVLLTNYDDGKIRSLSLSLSLKIFGFFHYIVYDTRMDTSCTASHVKEERER